MNKNERFQSNLAALSLAFGLAGQGRKAKGPEVDILSKYTGFGGLNEILFDPRDEVVWKSGTQNTRQYVLAFHEMLGKYDPARKEEFVKSAKSSVLTGFYTPIPIICALSGAIKNAGIKLTSVLDPSAGNGRFVEVIRSDHTPSDVLMYETDLLTGLVLSAKSQTGFELKDLKIQEVSMPTDSIWLPATYLSVAFLSLIPILPVKVLLSRGPPR